MKKRERERDSISFNEIKNENKNKITLISTVITFFHNYTHKLYKIVQNFLSKFSHLARKDVIT